MLVPTARLLLRLLPDEPAYHLTTFLASIPRRTPIDERGRAALRSATRLRWGSRRGHVALAWGEGPLVLLVHGWHGRALQMAPLGRHLAALGFRAVAPDLRGHGESPGRRISFRQFVDDIGALAQELNEPLHALIGHSAGGLTMMAARDKYGMRAANYVCINAPRAPYPPITTLRRLLHPRESVLERCREYFFAQFDIEAHRLDCAAAFRHLGQGRLLLIYDRDDDQVGHADAELIARDWPKAMVVKTSGLGHHRVLWSDDIHTSVGDFLGGARGPAVSRNETAPALALSY